jgi:hypothetical protein
MAPQALHVADLAVVGVSWSAARGTGCRPGRRRSPGCQRGPVPPAARTRPVPPDWSARRRPPPMPRPRGAPSGRPGVGRSPGAVPASCRLRSGSARNCQRGDRPDLGRPGRVGGVRPRTGIPTLQRRGLLRRHAPGLPLESARCSLGGLRGATLDHRGVQVEGGTAPGVGVMSSATRSGGAGSRAARTPLAPAAGSALAVAAPTPRTGARHHRSPVDDGTHRAASCSGGCEDDGRWPRSCSRPDQAVATSPVWSSSWTSPGQPATSGRPGGGAEAGRWRSRRAGRQAARRDVRRRRRTIRGSSPKRPEPVTARTRLSRPSAMTSSGPL